MIASVHDERQSRVGLFRGSPFMHDFESYVMLPATCLYSRECSGPRIEANLTDFVSGPAHGQADVTTHHKPPWPHP